MFVGHLGVGLALRRAEPAVSLGILFGAVLLPDFLLGVFVLLGLEQAVVPADYARRHYLRFVFPYSHGLVASVAWSALAAAGVALWYRGRPRRGAAAVVVAAAVFSHFVCDVIEHPPQLPLVGAASPRLGLGLWDHLALALGLEAVLVAAGLALYLGTTTHQGRLRRSVLAAAMVVLSALAFAGQALSSEPPGRAATLVAWLIQPVLLGGFGWWIDRPLAAGRTT